MRRVFVFQAVLICQGYILFQHVNDSLCDQRTSNVFHTENSTDSSIKQSIECKFNSSLEAKIVKTTGKINQDTDLPCQSADSEFSSDAQAIFDKLRKEGLYYSLQNIMEDIEMSKLKTGIVDLMYVHNRSQWISNMRNDYQARDKISKKKRMIFINVETVYDSKRDTITKMVARMLRGRQMTTPPKFMDDIRVIIGPGTGRKLFYSLTKYSTSNHIRNVLNTSPVVLERYWLHHAAFTIGKVYNKTDLPPKGHPIYQWPKDLLHPDIIFFVNATKNPFGSGFTQPYTNFTEKLIEVFRRAEGVTVVEMNPDKNYLKIARYIVNYVRLNFKDHPDVMVPDVDNIVNPKMFVRR